MTHKAIRMLTVTLLFCGWIGLSAQEIHKKDAPHPPPPPKVEETSSVTKHTIKIGDETVAYTATAGTYLLKEEGKPVASMFYMSYTKDGVKDLTKRPLLVSFNGGPSTASVWLHLGVLGPRTVLYDDNGFAYPPPARLIDNPYSILDVADVVFIDPVATGYSRMLPGEDPHKYHGTKGDIESLAEFIRMYVTRNKRWASPKFLIGESYGTVRAAGLAGHLHNAHTMFLNGVMLISMTSLSVETGGDIGFALILPHYTATAWYHKRLAPDLQERPLRELLDEAEAFAMTDYLTALAKGGYVPEAEKTEIVRKVSRYTGLSEEYIRNCNLRVERSRFRKELLRDQGRTVGRLDSRYTGIDRDAAGERNEYDPALADWEAAFASNINHYLRTELGYKTDLAYEIWGDVRPWQTDRSMHIGDMLRGAMTKNRYLEVFIAEGYYDAACDYLTAQYVFSHLDLNGEMKDRIHFGFYESGHMMYCHKPSIVKLKADLTQFIQSCVHK